MAVQLRSSYIFFGARSFDYSLSKFGSAWAPLFAVPAISPKNGNTVQSSLHRRPRVARLKKGWQDSRARTKRLLRTTESSQSSIYVYDDPAVDWSRLVECYRRKNGVAPWRDEEGEHAQNMAEVWVHQALLRHPSRTLDPSEASLYYIPLYATVSSDAEPRIGSLRCHGETHQERINNALDYLESESTYFTQFGGADHFFVCA